MRMGSIVRPGRAAMLLVPLCLSLFTIDSVQATPLEVYGHLPSVEDVALSPDGSKLAFVRTTEDLRGLAVVGVADHKFLGGAKLGDMKLRSLSWADDDHLLVTVSTTEKAYGTVGTGEYFHLFVYEVSSHKRREYPQYLTETTTQTHTRMMNVLAGSVMVRRMNGETNLFIPGVYVDEGSRSSAFQNIEQWKLLLLRVNLASGKESLVRKGDTSTRDWLVDESGEIAAEDDYDETLERWGIRIPRGSRLVGIDSGVAPIESPKILGFGPRGDSLLIASLQDGDGIWRQLSLKEGQFGPPMQGWQTMDRAIQSPLSQRLIGGVHYSD